MNVYELSKSFATEFTGCMVVGLMLGWSEINIKFWKIDIFTLGLIQFSCIAFVTWTAINFSGAILNPSITTSLAVSNRIKGYKVLSYLVAQLLGYLAGSILLRIIMPLGDKKDKAAQICYGCFKVKEQFNIVSVILTELIGGFLLAFAYYSSVIDKRASKGVYAVSIAAVYFVMNLSFGKLMTIGMNPFRYLAGALINFDFSFFYVYLWPSLVGATVCSKFFDEIVLTDQPKISENHIKFD